MVDLRHTVRECPLSQMRSWLRGMCFRRRGVSELRIDFALRARRDATASFQVREISTLRSPWLGLRCLFRTGG